MSPEIAGHISGALPLTFAYLLVLNYNENGYTSALKVSKSGLIGCLFWFIFASSTFVFLKYKQNIFVTIIGSLIIFVVSHILYPSISKLIE